MNDQWIESATNTHQDHVVAHVLGATVLGYFTADEAARFVLDIGFIWTIYLDCEMALLTEALVVSELSIGDDEKRELLEEVEALHRTDSGEAERFERVTLAPAGCTIEEVELFEGAEGRRRIVIRGEASSLAVESSVETRELRVQPVSTNGRQ